MVYFRIEMRRGNTTVVVEKAMEKKFGKLISNVGKNAKDLLEKSKDIAI